jgi:steroid delta-isomerase-like uncharacterized protein
MSLTPAAFLRHWFEQVWNAGRAELIEVHVPAEVEIHGLELTGQAVIGPAGFRAFYDRMRAAFSDIRIELHDVFESGDLAAARWTVHATHSGPGLNVPATNRAVTFTGMTMIRMQGDQIVESWNEWDKVSLLSAVGAITLSP